MARPAQLALLACSPPRRVIRGRLGHIRVRLARQVGRPVPLALQVPPERPASQARKALPALAASQVILARPVRLA